MDRIKTHIANNKIIYFIMVLFLTIGVVSGFVFAGFIAFYDSETIRQGLVFANFGFGEVFKKALLISLRIFIIICLAASFKIAKPLVFFAHLTKGFAIGFSLGLSIVCFSWRGFLISFISFLPDVLIFLPALFLFSYQALKAPKITPRVFKFMCLFLLFLILYAVFTSSFTTFFTNLAIGLI